MNDMSNQLSQLHNDIRKCRICIDDPKGAALPHPPNPVVILSSNAKIAICGQAPGNKVNISGVPFTDPSGDRLRDWLGVTSEQFYDPDLFSIVPMGFCFPGNDKNGGDLPPRKECAATWHGTIFDEMKQIEIKLLIGGSAQKYHLGKAAQKSVTETVREWRTHLEERACLPMPHPSWRNSGWIKKNLWFENDLLPVLRELIQRNIG